MVDRRHGRLVVTFWAGLVLGCGSAPVEQGPTGSGARPSAQTITITIQPNAVQVPANGTVAFVAEVDGSADERLTWSVAEQGGGGIDSAGRYTAPEAPGEYHVVATSVSQPSARAVATVSVMSGALSEPGGRAPGITSFAATPATITAGDATTLSWSTSNAEEVILAPDPGTVTGTSAIVSPESTTTYTLTVKNGAVTAIAKTTVTVLPPGSVPPASAPTIASFSASPASIYTGGSTTLSWSAANASSLTITPDVGAVTGSSTAVSPSRTTTYTLTASSAGGTASATATVTVSPPPPAPAPGSFGTGGTSTAGHVGVTGGGPLKPSASGGVSVLDHGARGDGSSDDTDAFQEAANAARSLGRALVIPATPNGYRLTHRVFIYSSVIGVGYPLIRMTGSRGSDQTEVLETSYTGPGMWITGLRIDGGFDPTGRALPGGSSSNQYSHGIALVGARNITIEDNLIQNVAGDLIYLGTPSIGAAPTSNVLINGNTAINPFRNGIAFVHTDGIAVTNNVFIKLNTFAITYDIEPNGSGDTNYDIEIAYNQESIPTTIQNSAGNNEYVRVGDINCGAAGGDLWFHDEAIFPGGTIDGTYYGPGSWGDGWYNGTTCSNYSNVNVDPNLR